MQVIDFKGISNMIKKLLTMRLFIVTFSYRNSERVSIENCSLIHPGEV